VRKLLVLLVLCAAATAVVPGRAAAADACGRPDRVTNWIDSAPPALAPVFARPGTVLAVSSGEFPAQVRQQGAVTIHFDQYLKARVGLPSTPAEPDTVVVYVSQVCALRSDQGRAGEIVELLERAVEDTPGIPALEAGLAWILCDLGRTDDAAARLERAVDARFAALPRDQVHSTALATWARTATDVGSRRAAERLYDLIEPWRDLVVWNGTTGYGSAEAYLGMLAATLDAHERAEEHFAAASALHRREGMGPWEARSLCHRARSLRAAGDTDRARATAQEALALARDRGYVALAAQAEELLHVEARA